MDLCQHFKSARRQQIGTITVIVKDNDQEHIVYLHKDLVIVRCQNPKFENIEANIESFDLFVDYLYGADIDCLRGGYREESDDQSRELDVDVIYGFIRLVAEYQVRDFEYEIIVDLELDDTMESRIELIHSTIKTMDKEMLMSVFNKYGIKVLKLLNDNEIEVLLNILGNAFNFDGKERIHCLSETELFRTVNELVKQGRSPKLYSYIHYGSVDRKVRETLDLQVSSMMKQGYCMRDYSLTTNPVNNEPFVAYVSSDSSYLEYKDDKHIISLELILDGCNLPKSDSLVLVNSYLLKKINPYSYKCTVQKWSYY